jgi:hypothetical protein
MCWLDKSLLIPPKNSVAIVSQTPPPPRQTDLDRDLSLGTTDRGRYIRRGSV